jgi:tRNA(Ile)-lysidine synthase TilS/MesJ
MKKLKPALKREDFEDEKVLKQLNQIFLSKRGYDFRMPQKDDPVVIQISGGLDSIAIWNILLGKYKLHVYPVHFFNPNRFFRGEEESIKYYSGIFKKLYPKNFHEVNIINAPSTNKINRLTPDDVSPKIILNNLLYNENINKYQLLLNYGDNPLYERFFNVYTYAQKLRSTVAKNLNTIFSNFVVEDATISRNSTLTVLRSINLSLCLILGDFSWQFSAALEKNAGFYLTKEKLIKYAKQKGVNLSKSWSCMYRGANQCGECACCIIRKEAFGRAKIKDPTEYKTKKIFKTGLRRYFKKILSEIYNKTDKIFIHKKSTIKYKSFDNLFIHPSPDVAWEEINGRINILHRKKGEIDILNKSGSLIWQDIAKGTNSFNSLYSYLIKRYKTKGSILKEDLNKFLNYCLSEGYLTIK